MMDYINLMKLNLTLHIEKILIKFIQNIRYKKSIVKYKNNRNNDLFN
jgi:hypothetical protein